MFLLEKKTLLLDVIAKKKKDKRRKNHIKYDEVQNHIVMRERGKTQFWTSILIYIYNEIRF